MKKDEYMRGYGDGFKDGRSSTNNHGAGRNADEANAEGQGNRRGRTTGSNPVTVAHSDALPSTGPYVDRIIRIFRDHPVDDTSALVLIEFARAALNAQPSPGTAEEWK